MLRCCKKCHLYTLKEICPKCKQKTVKVGYKFKQKYAKVKKLK